MQKLAAVFFRAASWIRAHRWLSLGCLVIGVFAIGIAHPPVALAGTAEEISKYVLSGMTGAWLINFLAWILNNLASVVGRLIVTLIDAILVPILNYNGFATSTIVDLGWSLVRDTVNMFVVVILLVIAALTIVGSPKANWQQQIPRLFIFTVAVNFSRTICGIALDISNVVMFQFVNAILVVGAGNFAQLLQINYYGDYSVLESFTTGPAENFATAWLQLALMLSVLGVILIMTIVYLYRIVVLWLLIIMSPMAFFAGGIKDIVGPAGGIYGQWMKKFTSALFLGPVLTFFLWLALAAASTGSIVEGENFPVGEATEGFGIALKVLEMSNLTSLLIGLVLLVLGMQMAGSFAGDLGDFAGKLINGGMGQSIAKRALMLPARGFGKVGREFGRQADRWGGLALDKAAGTHKGSMLSHIGGGIMKQGEALRNNGGVIGGVAGRLITAGGDKFSKQGDSLAHHAHEHAEKRVKDWSDDRKASEQRVAWKRLQDPNQNNHLRWSNDDNQANIVAELATTRASQKVFEDQIKALKAKGDPASLTEAAARQKEFDDGMRATIKYVEENKAHYLTDDAKKKFFAATKSRYLDLSPDIADFVNSEDFTGRIVRPSAISSPEAQEIEDALKKKWARSENGEDVFEWAEMKRGARGNELQAAVVARERAMPPPAPVPPAGAPLVTNANLISPVGPPMSESAIAANIAAGNLNVGTLTAAHFDPANANSENLVKAMVQAGLSPRDVSEPSGTARDAYVQRLTELADANQLSSVKRAEVDNYNLDNRDTGHSAPGKTEAKEVFKDAAGPGGYDLSRITNAMDQNIMVLRHLTDAIASSGGDQVSATVTNVLSPQNIRDLSRAFSHAVGDEREQIKTSLTNAMNAVVKTMQQAPPPRGTEWKKHNAKLNELYEQIEAAAGRASIPVRPKPTQ